MGRYRKAQFYYVWRGDHTQPYRCYPYYGYESRPSDDDPNLIWRGDSYLEGRRAAARANDSSPRYFVLRLEPDCFRVFATRKWRGVPDRAVWSGNDLEEGQRVAREANIALYPPKPAHKGEPLSEAPLESRDNAAEQLPLL